jgi:hypothetical protein
MAKIKPIGKVVDKAAILLQKLVRLKAADQWGICTCVTCGKRAHYKEMDAGHFISRTYAKWKLHEENIHPQCKGCNRYASRSIDNYFIFMVDTYGEDTVRHMIDTKKQIHKWNRITLDDQIQDFKNRIREQEVRLGVE